MKYYAVKLGRQTGIFETWGEAEAQVKGFPNAKFKSFSSFEEAKSYLEDSNQSQSSNLVEYEAYVDGSFDKNKNIDVSGVVIIKNNEVIEKISFSGSDEKYIESYQVAGEVKAALRAMEWAVNHNISSIAIYYDYEGIRSWALGEWKTNKAVSKDYKYKFDVLSRRIDVYFKKVKAHSGVYFNELADELAKSAALGRVFISETNEEKSNVESNLSEFLMNSDSADNQGNLIYINDFIVSDKRIVKFIKDKWKSNGRKVGEIKKLTYELDFNKKLLTAKIEADEVTEYRIEW